MNAIRLAFLRWLFPLAIAAALALAGAAFSQLAQAQPANVQALDSRAAAGQKVFMNASCSACHGIKGTPANGSAGPDLTHIASRNMFAAETEPINATTLSQWITDPSSMKAGVKMPGTHFSQEDLSNLVAFLMSLK